MALIATDSGGGNFKQIPGGVYIGRCYRLIDLGTQHGEYQGVPNLKRKVMVSWELFGEDADGQPLSTDDGKPLVISKRYTLSLGKNAALRSDLESWRGKSFTDAELKGFNVSNLLGVYAMVNVTIDERDGKTYSNVKSLSPLPSALKNSKPLAVNDDEEFDVTAPDMEMFERFSDKLKETIRACTEWKANGNAAAVSARPERELATTADDDIPDF